MTFKLNIITVSLLAMSGSAIGANFAVGNANTELVNMDKYQCNRCVSATGYSGKVTLLTGYNSPEDAHAGNALSSDEEGAIAAVSGDVHFINDTGYKASMQAHQLGMDNGFANIKVGKSGLYELELDYQAIKTFEAGDVRSQLWQNDGMLTPSVYPNQFDLALQREKSVIGLSYGEGVYNTFVRFSQEEKTGHQSASFVAPSPTNFGLPVDSTTKQLDAGASLAGENWLTELSYFGSYYSNSIEDLSLPYMSDVYSAAPDNQAHQISLSGQYQLDRTVMSGRLVTGRMIQDDSLIQMSGNPLQSWDGEIETLDGRFAVSSMLSNRLRVGASVDHSKRDNKSSSWEFTQYSYNALSGAFKQNVPQDIERNTYKVNASYRLASGYRIQAGFDRKEIDRSYSEREQTDENNLWAKLSVSAFDNININVKASHGVRGGSEYEVNELTSSEDNILMRKYYLADRTRNAVELKLNHSPLSWVSIDLVGRYAIDDYDVTIIGLTESQDYGYDLNISLQLSKDLSAYGFAGQQWIDSTQAGSQSFSAPDWQADIQDEFINLGAGISYGGLMEDKLTLGGDYLFSNSISDTYLDGSAVTNSALQYGDYFAYNHSVSMYADYALSPKMALKLSYQYERYYDTDGAQMGINTVPGLTTLGELNHDYNAHQVMLSFSYLLR
ncbi:MtrB/PioB family decaheme-associated outer membrane protein [Shewanella sp. D64]|uniref:MtrB/PioB family decaheme-associated outer membrane protein n=1 Tax=unclassified Shewanella TaxID=196818 RepID=UPI0022BA4956|nr:MULTISPECIES: MtrB/PioB family decaheme-associated outer membrane protein [unclassified Shewanella]MEC4728740.1 MtrB/PioB family decaheme-associated outer membrane protein [Shewanella sp. D64]MEC4740609.1 MtrB/PioB family decaheme-associated outer membrane protein [Shewanella sp. E94]WBJ95124.1 MtrB/PioB family decaheme-associated outer membrane protein [Shewanella sp. MTB7]